MTELLKKHVILILAFLAVACGFASWWLLEAYLESQLYTYEPNEPEAIRVLVPAENLMPGTKLDAGNLRIRNIPQSVLPEDLIHPSELQSVINRTIGFELKAGLPIQWLHLLPEHSLVFSDLLAKGESAVSFILSKESGHGGLFVVGDRIDVVDKEQGITVSEGLEVISIEGTWNDESIQLNGQQSNNRKSQQYPTNQLVTLRTSHQDFALLKQGLSSGRLVPRLLNSTYTNARTPIRTVTYIYPGSRSQKELICEDC